MSDDILARLMAVLESRKDADPETSYVASLYHEGLDAILEKISEESAETIVAAKSGDKKQIVYETADLWFHCLVLLAQYVPHWNRHHRSWQLILLNVVWF